MQETQYREVEIKEFHVNAFVKEILERVKDGWEFKDYESIHYTPQWVGSYFTTTMIKKEQPVKILSLTIKNSLKNSLKQLKRWGLK